MCSGLLAAGELTSSVVVPNQVLAIQYGGSAAKCGGFFPNCVNGKIQG